jgi:hypothetical protein
MYFLKIKHATHMPTPNADPLEVHKFSVISSQIQERERKYLKASVGKENGRIPGGKRNE